MSNYMICYDLLKAGQNYQFLYKKIESYGTYWNIQRSIWIIKTDETASEIAHKLSNCFDGNDKLLVTKLEGEAAWLGYSQNVSNWLMESLD